MDAARLVGALCGGGALKLLLALLVLVGPWLTLGYLAL
jgi:hypothetical protein